MNLRQTVLTADGTPVREQRLAVTLLDAALLPEGDRVVIHARVSDRERSDRPLHILEQGELAVSFGQPLSDGATSSIALRRRVATDAGARIYAMPEFEYRVEVFDGEGRRLATINGPEFNESLPVPGQVWVTMDNPPRSKVVDLRIDREWRLWVMLEIVEDDWRDAVKEVRSATGDLVIHPISDDWTDVYDMPHSSCNDR